MQMRIDINLSDYSNTIFQQRGKKTPRNIGAVSHLGDKARKVTLPLVRQVFS